MRFLWEIKIVRRVWVVGIVVLIIFLGMVFISQQNKQIESSQKSTDGEKQIPDVTQITPASAAKFENPQKVKIIDYNGHAMEPYISRDGEYLFWNNLNNLDVENTNLHYAKKISDVTFVYKGEIKGVNTEFLEAVPAIDRNGNFFFVSTKSYTQDFSTLYTGEFKDGSVKNVRLLSMDFSKGKPPYVNFDVEISADGNTLYAVEGTFKGGAVPTTAKIILAFKNGELFEAGDQSILKNINTDALEYAPSISSDGLELYFTRLAFNAVGMFDRDEMGIYVSTRDNLLQPFGEPVKIEAIQGSNTEGSTITDDGNTVYFHKKDGKLFSIFKVSRVLDEN